MINVRFVLRATLLSVALSISIGMQQTLAQLTPGIIADRPSQLSPFSQPGIIQLQTGISYETSGSEARDQDADHAWLLGMLFRTGIVETAELRIGFEYVNEMHRTGSEAARGYGLRNLSIGTKLSLVEETGLTPAISLFANAHLPFGQDDYRPHTVVPGFLLQADYDFDQRAMITGNLGSEWNAASSEMLATYTATLAVPIDDRFTAFGDLTGQFTATGSPAHACDLGITLCILDHFQIDLAGGLGFTSAAPNYFLNSGFSCRIN